MSSSSPTANELKNSNHNKSSQMCQKERNSYNNRKTSNPEKVLGSNNNGTYVFNKREVDQQDKTPNVGKMGRRVHLSMDMPIQYTNKTQKPTGGETSLQFRQDSSESDKCTYNASQIDKKNKKKIKDAFDEEQLEDNDEEEEDVDVEDANERTPLSKRNQSSEQQQNSSETPLLSGCKSKDVKVISEIVDDLRKLEPANTNNNNNNNNNVEQVALRSNVTKRLSPPSTLTLARDFQNTQQKSLPQNTLIPLSSSSGHRGKRGSIRSSSSVAGGRNDSLTIDQPGITEQVSPLFSVGAYPGQMANLCPYLMIRL